jgi:hypothetical protein
VSSPETDTPTGLRLFVRILKLPSDKVVEGIDVRRFDVGGVYEVGPHLAELLVRSGYATIESRRSP